MFAAVGQVASVFASDETVIGVAVTGLEGDQVFYDQNAGPGLQVTDGTAAEVERNADRELDAGKIQRRNADVLQPDKLEGIGVGDASGGLGRGFLGGMVHELRDDEVVAGGGLGGEGKGGFREGAPFARACCCGRGL